MNRFRHGQRQSVCLVSAQGLLVLWAFISTLSPIVGHKVSRGQVFGQRPSIHGSLSSPPIDAFYPSLYLLLRCIRWSLRVSGLRAARVRRISTRILPHTITVAIIASNISVVNRNLSVLLWIFS